MIIDGSFAIEFKARGAWPVGLVMVGGVNGGCFGGDQVCLCGFFPQGNPRIATTASYQTSLAELRVAEPRYGTGFAWEL